MDFPESLLIEDDQPVAMVTGGEDEEGAISDPGSEMMEENSDKVKVARNTKIFVSAVYGAVFNGVSVQLLDRLLWYLRVVHSLDFYNAMVFPSEDCMPHRCCIFTVRPAMPSTPTSLEEGEGTTAVCEWESLGEELEILHCNNDRDGNIS